MVRLLIDGRLSDNETWQTSILVVVAPLLIFMTMGTHIYNYQFVVQNKLLVYLMEPNNSK